MNDQDREDLREVLGLIRDTRTQLLSGNPDGVLVGIELSQQAIKDILARDERRRLLGVA